MITRITLWLGRMVCGVPIVSERVYEGQPIGDLDQRELGFFRQG